MQRVKISPSLNLADATFVSLTDSRDQLIWVVKDWQDAILTITFKEVVAYKWVYEDYSDYSEEEASVVEDSDLLKEFYIAFKKQNDNLSEEKALEEFKKYTAALKHFLFHINHVGTLEVVSKDLTVTNTSKA